MLMLIDAVSGRVVHSMTHAGMQGPLTTTLADNFLIYHYWNPEALTYQMGVVELFTNSTAPSDPISLLLGGAPDYSLRENGFDSYGAPAPRPLSQAYGFSAAVATLGVTQTIAGLTPKHVLVGTSLYLQRYDSEPYRIDQN